MPLKLVNMADRKKGKQQQQQQQDQQQNQDNNAGGVHQATQTDAPTSAVDDVASPQMTAGIPLREASPAPTPATDEGKQKAKVDATSPSTSDRVQPPGKQTARQRKREQKKRAWAEELAAEEDQKAAQAAEESQVRTGTTTVGDRLQKFAQRLDIDSLLLGPSSIWQRTDEDAHMMLTAIMNNLESVITSLLKAKPDPELPRELATILKDATFMFDKSQQAKLADTRRSEFVARKNVEIINAELSKGWTTVCKTRQGVQAHEDKVAHLTANVGDVVTEASTRTKLLIKDELREERRADHEAEFRQLKADLRAERMADLQQLRAEREADQRQHKAEREADQRQHKAEREADQRQHKAEREADQQQHKAEREADLQQREADLQQLEADLKAEYMAKLQQVSSNLTTLFRNEMKTDFKNEFNQDVKREMKRDLDLAATSAAHQVISYNLTGKIETIIGERERRAIIDEARKGVVVEEHFKKKLKKYTKQQEFDDVTIAIIKRLLKLPKSLFNKAEDESNGEDEPAVDDGGEDELDEYDSSEDESDDDDSSEDQSAGDGNDEDEGIDGMHLGHLYQDVDTHQ